MQGERVMFLPAMACENCGDAVMPPVVRCEFCAPRAAWIAQLHAMNSARTMAARVERQHAATARWQKGRNA